MGRHEVEHLADIVRNATLFHQRWGWWPMAGWLDNGEPPGWFGRDDDVILELI